MFGYITSDIDNLQVRTIHEDILYIDYSFPALLPRILGGEQGQGIGDLDGDLQRLQGGDEATAGQGDRAEQDRNTEEEGRGKQAEGKTGDVG